METDFSIRILESENNKKGDLFTRLMENLFSVLGYHKFQLNRQKSGREIDIEGFHRKERRRLIAECKAVHSKIGGDNINKFVGCLDAEKRKLNIDTIGYFISLWGFKGTALEQEEQVGGSRVILLDGKQVVEELIKGHIIVSQEVAMERAGRCASKQSSALKPDKKCELLAHECGWIWAIYFVQNRKRTHFSLIHADGEPLTIEMAKYIIQADKSVRGNLHSLTYLPPPNEVLILDKEIEEGKKKYFEYLATECGEITLEGMPADQEVSCRHLKLENIFVPLYLEEFSDPARTLSPQLMLKLLGDKLRNNKRQNIGNVLSKNSKLAILAPPGGGKSTLIKSLAIAYAFPERRKLIDESIPERTLFPIFIRCRQLGDLVNYSISEVLQSIPKKAELRDNLFEPFMHIIRESIQNGNALILIDGLDEISEDNLRISFVNQLRTFLSIYPRVNVVITSREAGFTKISGILGEQCNQYKISEFNDDDIKRLTLTWHKEVLGDREEVRSKAESVAKTICNTDRVKQLAVNPLLLTTILLVNRWVGQLPTKKSVLYGKAIEVLLMTWNVEGHRPIDQDEAIPQLAFVAHYMMEKGIQRISSRKLKEILTLARTQMPEVLGYARLSVQEFIQRIELRSSLLILTGHEIEDGKLLPFYEFRHLTFQEYLTAIAITEGYYVGRKDEDNLLTILETHLKDERWEEVVTLSSVLSGRNARCLIECLIQMCKKKEKIIRKNKSEFDFFIFDHNKEYDISNLLGKCILDEVQITPPLLDEGLECVIRGDTEESIIFLLCENKYGQRIEDVARRLYIESDTDLFNIGNNLSKVLFHKMDFDKILSLEDLIYSVLQAQTDRDPIKRLEGILTFIGIVLGRVPANLLNQLLSKKESNVTIESIPDENETGIKFQVNISSEGDSFRNIVDKMFENLYSEEKYLHFSACWALAVAPGNCPQTKIPDVIKRLFHIWSNSKVPDIQYAAAWAIAELPINDRDEGVYSQPTNSMVNFVREQFSTGSNSFRVSKLKIASLIMGFYWKQPWSDEELATNFATLNDQDPTLSLENIKPILESLGEPGKAVIEAWKPKKDFLSFNVKVGTGKLGMSSVFDLIKYSWVDFLKE